MISVPSSIYNSVEPFAGSTPPAIWEAIVYLESDFKANIVNSQHNSFGLFQLLYPGGQGDNAIHWIMKNQGLQSSGAVQYLLGHPSLQAKFGMTAINRAWSNLGNTYNANDVNWWLQFCSQSGHPGGSTSDPVTQAYVNRIMTEVVKPNLFNIQSLGAPSDTPNNTTTSIVGTYNMCGDKTQCTWYAAQRYHQLTGIWLPFCDNAAKWQYNASQYNWFTFNIPVVPSIICLQPGIQLADSQYGHVGIVESINSDGTVHVSNLNWGITPQQRTKVSYVDFKTGQGVTFICAVNGSNPVASKGFNTPLSISKLLNTATNASQAINDIPGFLGVCVALDKAEQFSPFAIPGEDSSLFGIPYLNVVADANNAVNLPANLIRGIIGYITTNTVAFFIRAFFVLLGIVVLWALLINVTSHIVEESNGNQLPLAEGAMIA